MTNKEILKQLVTAGEKATQGNMSQSHRADKDGMYNTETYTGDGEMVCLYGWYPKPYVDEHGRNCIATYRGDNAEFVTKAFNARPAIKEMLERLERLEDTAENLLIAIGMGWDLEGCADALRQALEGQEPVNETPKSLQV